MNSSDPTPAVHVIGAGPAGLMVATRLAEAGHKVIVHERMPSPARKLLMAGRGGLNLTHSEAPEPFLSRYSDRAGPIRPWLETFSASDLVAWVEDLGQPTFVGSSGRIFPRAMKASPLVRAWLGRLSALGVEIRIRSIWRGWQDGQLLFDTPHGPVLEHPAATVLALGGASWPRLGSQGEWTGWLEEKGIEVAPFQASNAGVNIDWSSVIVERFAGQPLKPVSISLSDRTLRAELVLTRYGLEGSAIYALSQAFRETIEKEGSATLTLDLRPDLGLDALTERLSRPRGKDSVTNWLRKVAGLSPAAIGILRDIPGDLPTGPEKLARRIKAVRLKVTGQQGLERAISSAGGVRFEAVDEHMMLKALPGVFVAGEMLDWEAPTGGYLLQATLACGVVAANGVKHWLDASGSGRSAP